VPFISAISALRVLRASAIGQLQQNPRDARPAVGTRKVGEAPADMFGIFFGKLRDMLPPARLRCQHLAQPGERHKRPDQRRACGERKRTLPPEQRPLARPEAGANKILGAVFRVGPNKGNFGNAIGNRVNAAFVLQGMNELIPGAARYQIAASRIVA
jgi:hypothetical protein